MRAECFPSWAPGEGNLSAPSLPVGLPTAPPWPSALRDRLITVAHHGMQGRVLDGAHRMTQLTPLQAKPTLHTRGVQGAPQRKRSPFPNVRPWEVAQPSAPPLPCMIWRAAPAASCLPSAQQGRGSLLSSGAQGWAQSRLAGHMSIKRIVPEYSPVELPFACLHLWRIHSIQPVPNSKNKTPRQGNTHVRGTANLDTQMEFYGRTSKAVNVHEVEGAKSDQMGIIY